MEDVNNKSVSDTNVDSVSDATDNPGRENQKDTVNYETHRKLLAQRKNDMLRMQEMENQIKSFQDKEKSLEEQKLAEQGEYKKLLELREQEIANLKQKTQEAYENLNQKDKMIQNAHKLDAVYEKLPGKIKRQECVTAGRICDIDVKNQGQTREVLGRDGK